MLAVSLKLNPPIQYSLIWLLIGLGLLLLIGIWYGVLFWLTRRKAPTTIATLQPLASPTDLEALKAKYLKLIDECYQSYVRKETNLRGLHRGLSMVVRYFVYEVNHFPAPRLTLSDLKRAQYPRLTNVIDDFYGKEFAMIEHGEPQQAVAAAKEMVQQWV